LGRKYQSKRIECAKYNIKLVTKKVKIIVKNFVGPIPYLKEKIDKFVAIEEEGK